MKQAQRLRRAKRQDKRFNKLLVRRTIKKLFGDLQEIPDSYKPDKDPNLTNHKRWVERRIRDGRITLNGKRWNPDTGEFDVPV